MSDRDPNTRVRRSHARTAVLWTFLSLVGLAGFVGLLLLYGASKPVAVVFSVVILSACYGSFFRDLRRSNLNPVWEKVD